MAVTFRSEALVGNKEIVGSHSFQAHYKDTVKCNLYINDALFSLVITHTKDESTDGFVFRKKNQSESNQIHYEVVNLGKSTSCMINPIELFLDRNNKLVYSFQLALYRPNGSFPYFTYQATFFRENQDHE